MTTDNRVQYFGRDLEAMTAAVNYHKWILDHFLPYTGKNVAEIGAGTGCITSMLAQTDIEELTSFEPSENMFTLLQQNTAQFDKVRPVHAYLGDKIDSYEDAFDSIFYVNVLEHVKNEQQEMTYARRALKENGYLLIFVPALSWLYSDFDKNVGHMRRYSKNSLRECVEQGGFEIDKLFYLDFFGIIPWLIVFKLMGRTLTGDSVSLYDKMVIPVLRFAESIVAPPLGKNLLLVARKKN